MIGWPAGGPERGGPVCGIGAGACGGAGVVDMPPRSPEGTLLIDGLGLDGGDGATVDGNELGRELGGGGVEPVCARAGPVASATAARASAT